MDGTRLGEVGPDSMDRVGRIAGSEVRVLWIDDYWDAAFYDAWAARPEPDYSACPVLGCFEDSSSSYG